jgi:hypothetical protein
MLGMVAVLVDCLGLLSTSIVGKVMESNDKMNDSHFIYLLIPLYIGVLFYFVQIVWNRISKMMGRCTLMSVPHLIGDLGRFTMELLIILGTCLSLIEGEVYTGYNFHTVVLIYGIYKLFGWLRYAIGGFTEIGYYNGDIFHGNDVMPDDKDEKKKVVAGATFLFKKDENGFSINKRNYTQMGDMSRLFVSIACLAIWNDFGDPAQMARDLFGVFVATLVWASVYFVYHIVLFVYLKHEMGNLSNELMDFIFAMVFLISTLKGFMVATMIGTLYGVANYLNGPSETLFDYSIALSVLLIIKLLLWMFMFGKIYSMSQSTSTSV